MSFEGKENSKKRPSWLTLERGNAREVRKEIEKLDTE
jgi:hypothetical protein